MRPASSREMVLACAAFAAGAVALALFGFGPLDPPNGPISPTYKTLSDVEPRIAINASNTPGDADSTFKITQSGSYYLTGNITGVSGKSGIKVLASDCTIDLEGFELTGVKGSLDGIKLNDFRGTIRNGRITDWGGDGIAGANCAGCLFEDLYVTGNIGIGLSVGKDSILSRVRALSNISDGIRAQGSCTIVECIASQNIAYGVNSGTLSTVSRCNARSNGLDGIFATAEGNISDCVSASNHYQGIYAAGGIVRDNVCKANLQDGILATGGIVRDNVCDANAKDNIYIDFPGGAIVRNNTCNNGAGDGINCQGRSSYVEANLVKSNLLGIELEKYSNTLLVRNYSVENTNGYYIGNGSNCYGHVIVDPNEIFDHNSWANFQH